MWLLHKQEFLNSQIKRPVHLRAKYAIEIANFHKNGPGGKLD